MPPVFRLNQAALDRALYREVKPWIQGTVEAGAAAARVTAPAVTYELRQSIEARVEGVNIRDLAGYVVATAPHAKDVHNGTRPHVIVPRRKKVLRFRTNSGVVFTRRVNHPGTRPNPWLREAVIRVFRRRT